MDLERLDTAALAAKLEEVIRSNDFLKKENAVWEAYLRRHVSKEDADDWADEEMRGKRKGKGRKPRAATLTLDQRLDVATTELDAVKKQNAEAEAKLANAIDTFKAMLERTDMRIVTLRREAYEFKRDVVMGGENPRTGTINLERVVRYYEDQHKAKDAQLDKLRLKIGTLRSTLARLEASWHEKEEVGDVLHYIDFHQLQIENKQFLAKIEEKNAELMRLKLSTGKTVQTLNAMKVALGAAGKESARLKADIRARLALLARLKADNEGLAAAVATAQESGVALSRMAKEASDMPTVMDYVQLKAVQAELIHEAQSWSRKVEIMNLTAKQAAVKAGATHAYVDTLTAAPIRTTVRLHSPGAGGITTRVLGTPAESAGMVRGGGATMHSTALSSVASSAASSTRISRPILSAHSVHGGRGAPGGSMLPSAPVHVPLPKGVGGFPGGGMVGSRTATGTLRLGRTNVPAAAAGHARVGGSTTFAPSGAPVTAAFGSTAKR